MKTPSQQSLRFHIDMTGCDLSEPVEFHGLGQIVEVKPHNEVSISSIPDTHVLNHATHYKPTHFADLIPRNENHFAAQIVQVVSRPEKGALLGRMLRLGYHFPDLVLRQIWRDLLRSQDEKGARTGLTSRLLSLGLTELPADEDAALELFLTCNTVIDPISTACALVGLSPTLISVNPRDAVRVQNRHILGEGDERSEQFQNVSNLASTIQNLGSAWSQPVDCTDERGHPILAEYDLPMKSDPTKFVWRKGQVMQRSDVHPDVLEAARPVVETASNSAADDPGLSRLNWTPLGGATAQAGSVVAPESTHIPKEESKYTWTVMDAGYHHGIKIPSGSVASLTTSSVKAEVFNRFSRTACLGYRFFDKSGRAVGGVTATEHMIPALDCFAGIPYWPKAHDIEVTDMPADAAEIEFLFGSFGIDDWTKDISGRGASATVMFQVVTPTVIAAAGGYITSFDGVRRLIDDKVLMGIVGGLFVWTYSEIDCPENAFHFAAKFGAGKLAAAGMESLVAFIAETVTEGDLFASALGPAGVAYLLAGQVGTVAGIAVTTSQCLSAPATTKVRCRRGLRVRLGVKPDPKDGVWPLVADNFRAELHPLNGEPQIVTGSCANASGQSGEIWLQFDNVIVGTQFRLSFKVYSDNGWLAGQWGSPEIYTAKLEESESFMRLGSFAITENIIPLDRHTQYHFHSERKRTDDGNVVWSEKGEVPPPTTLEHHLSGHGQSSNPIRSLANLGYKADTHELYFAWHGAKQARGRERNQEGQSHGIARVPKDRPNVMGSEAEVSQSTTPIVPSQMSVGPGTDYAWFTNRVINIGSWEDAIRYSTDPGRGEMSIAAPVGQEFGGHLGIYKCTHGIANLRNSHKFAIGAFDRNEPRGGAPSFTHGGSGERPGLMRGPQQIRVAPDGRILIYEAGNNRVQAFDVRGNPVYCFAPDDYVHEMDLDDWKRHVEQGDLSPLYDRIGVDGQTDGIPFGSEVVPLLNAGFAKAGTALVHMLCASGIDVVFDKDRPDDPRSSAQVHKIREGVWHILDPRRRGWRMEQPPGFDGPFALEIPVNAEVEISPGGKNQLPAWRIVDDSLGRAWYVGPRWNDPSKLCFTRLLPYFPVDPYRHNIHENPQFEVLDVAVESKGYVYVLTRKRLSGTHLQDEVEDYALHLYHPLGHLLSTTPDQTAAKPGDYPVFAKMDVDDFRTVYGLGFGAVWGGSPSVCQPQLSRWFPNPPSK